MLEKKEAFTPEAQDEMLPSTIRGMRRQLFMLRHYPKELTDKEKEAAYKIFSCAVRQAREEQPEDKHALAALREAAASFQIHPKLYICESDDPHAFAVRKTGRIFVSSRTVELLTHEELSAIFTHELTHLTQKGQSQGFWEKYVHTSAREHRCDEAAMEEGRHVALKTALQKMDLGMQEFAHSLRQIRAIMRIAFPGVMGEKSGNGGLWTHMRTAFQQAGFFASHPPIEDRLRRLGRN